MTGPGSARSTRFGPGGEIELGQVGAGAEAAPGAGEDQPRGSTLSASMRSSAAHRSWCIARVKLLRALRAVERDQRDGAARLEQDRGFAHGGVSPAVDSSIGATAAVGQWFPLGIVGATQETAWPTKRIQVRTEAGKVGIVTLQPAQAAQRAERPAHGRARRGAQGLRCRRRDRLHRSSPAARRHSPPAPTSRAMASYTSPTSTSSDYITPQLGDHPQHPQAGDRRGERLRAGRRLRAGDDVRLHHRRRQREVRPARDQARHHPRRRRHAAPAARGGQVQGDGHGADRAHDGRGRKPSAPGWSAASCRWTS